MVKHWIVSFLYAANYIIVSLNEHLSFVNVNVNIYVFGTYFCINVTFLVLIAMKKTYCLFQIKFVTEYTNLQHVIITQI